MKKKRASQIPAQAKLPELPVIGKGRGDAALRQGKKLIEAVKKGSVLNIAGEEGDSASVIPTQSNAVLRMAVIISIVFHLGLLTIKFAGPEAINDFFKGSQLEVVLLNVQSIESPTEARLLAQENYAGGGESPEDVYATSPLAYSAEVAFGDSFEETLLRLEASRQESIRQLNAAKSSYAQLPPIDPNWGQDDPRRVAEEERRRQLSNQIAAVEQRVMEENARPRRIYIGPATRKDARALYYDTIRKKIELRGTESFPQHAGLPLFGSLLMEIAVNPKGELVSATLKQGSGNPVLDRQAQAIALSSGPFQAAPAELLRVDKNVEFYFLMRFNFLNEGKLSAELVERR